MAESQRTRKRHAFTRSTLGKKRNRVGHNFNFEMYALMILDSIISLKRMKIWFCILRNFPRNNTATRKIHRENKNTTAFLSKSWYFFKSSHLRVRFLQLTAGLKKNQFVFDARMLAGPDSSKCRQSKPTRNNEHGRDGSRFLFGKLDRRLLWEYHRNATPQTTPKEST